MKIEYRKIGEIKEYKDNPRNNKNVNEVAESIKEFGFGSPILINKDDVIVAGHTRLRAAKILKLEEVPTIKIKDLTENQVKAFRLADNKTSEASGWNFEKLDEELEKISGIDMTMFGILNKDIETETTLEDMEADESFFKDLDDMDFLEKNLTYRSFNLNVTREQKDILDAFKKETEESAYYLTRPDERLVEIVLKKYEECIN